VVVDRLRVQYGPLVAVDASFEVAAGTIHGLIGANGAGKTTTLECLVGLRRPTAGSARLLGAPSPPPPTLFDEVAVFLQDRGALPNRLTAAEACRLYGTLHDDPRPPEEVLAGVGLTGRERAPYRTLSGGQRAKLHVALALIGRPRVLVLDEPTSGLDPEARHQLWRLLEEQRRAGVTILITTHLLDEAERFCDTVTILHRGQVVADGAPRQLLATGGFGLVARFPAPDHLRPRAVGRWWGRERDMALVVVAGSEELEQLRRVAEAEGLTGDISHRTAGLDELYLALTGYLQPVADQERAS
jgi:ABC-2 type transport system ATP-binding protein